MFILVVVFLTGCSKLICEPPTMIDYENDRCCEDLNKNRVCDEIEDKPLKFPGEEVEEEEVDLESDEEAEESDEEEDVEEEIDSEGSEEEDKMNPNAIIETNKGTMKIELFEDKAPKTVENFVKLAKKGFYDNLTFHRVIKDFMIQGGDPDGDGTGGPGYTIEDEFGPGLKHSKKGILSMANAGPDTGGSQFFITLVPTPWLDGKHAIFGQLVDGEDVLDEIGSVDTGANDKPVEDIIMKKVTITEVE